MADIINDSIALKRLSALFDDGCFTELDGAGDCGARIGFGSIDGACVYAYAEGDCKGVFDASCARKLEKIYDLAEKTGSPVVTVFDSCGASVKEGLKTIEACSGLLGRFSRMSGVVPQISAVVGNCGGFAALAAAMSDICVMSEDASMFLTAPFLDGRNKNGTADFAVNASAASIKCKADEVTDKVRTLVGMLPLNNLDSAPIWDSAEPEGDKLPMSVADKDSLIELYANDNCSTTTWLGCVAGRCTGFICAQGELNAYDTARMARMVGLCDSFSIPVVTFVDSEGFVKCSDNDLAGGIKNAAMLSSVYAGTTAPKISIITGKAIGTVYSLLCGKGAGNDMTYAWSDAVISALEPKAAVALLWDERIEKAGDIEELAKEYASTEASALKALESGAVDRVICPEQTRNVIIQAADMLLSKRVASLPKKHANLPY